MNQHSTISSVAVIGAGLSGLAAARHLADNGLTVRIFDKARGAGGRMSTRRHNGYEFDHGAQYFTVRDPVFRGFVDRWRDRGLVEPWRGRVVNIANGVVRDDHESVERYVPVPRMNSVCRDLSRDLSMTFTTRVSRIGRAGTGWALRSEEGRDLGGYDCVLTTTPPAQALDILPNGSGLASRIDAAEMLPCWALMVVFDRPIDVEWDGAFVFESPLSWVARNRSKPGRPGEEAWVIHGSPEWSEAHIETDSDTVRDELMTAFFTSTGAPRLKPIFDSIHRWLYAKSKRPLDAGHLFDTDDRIGVCGDWCRGDRVEDAFLSGLALAKAVEQSVSI